jgi:RNA polymerase II subunit A small phosphatase-like protein
LWVATKPLVKIKRRYNIPLERILIIEDDPLKVKSNYGNAIYVKPFQGDVADDELKHLTHYLQEIAMESNFRRIEKRGWKRRFITP